MVVWVFDYREILDEADTLTNWNQGTVSTTDFAEEPGSVALAINIGTDQLWITPPAGSPAGSPAGGSRNLTVPGKEMIYVWSANTALQNSFSGSPPANSSHGLWLSDGTNDIVFFQAGNDRDVFKHQDEQVLFQCFVLDADYASTKDAAGETYAVNGSFASLDFTAITEIGSYYVTNSKALGGGFNTFADIIRLGSRGIVAFQSGPGSPSTFQQFAEQDRNTTNVRAFGVIREYTAGTFGAQGSIGFGNNGGSPHTAWDLTGNNGQPWGHVDTWLVDSNISLTFEDRDIADDKLKFSFFGNALADINSHFFLSNSTISSARPAVEVEVTSNINEFSLTQVTFTNLKNPVTFPNDTYDGSPARPHSVTSCTFNACGQVDPGTTTFTNNTLSNSTLFTNPTGSPITGALLIDVDGTDYMSDLTFQNTSAVGSPITGHAVYISATGTYTFTNFTYEGYAPIDGSTGAEGVYNNSGGAVTITISGGEVPTVRNGSGATTTIVTGAVTTLVHAQTAALGVDIQNARVHVRASDGTGPLPFEDIVTITRAGSPETASVSHTAHGLSNGQKVLISDAAEEEYNGVQTISNVTTNAYDYPVTGTPATPATGTGSPETITSTGVIIDGLTDVNGDISDSRTYSGNQPIEGNVRKGTVTPLFKANDIISEVSATTGVSITISMVDDE